MYPTKNLLLILPAVLIIAISCSRGPVDQEKIAEVNEVPIYVKDFRREVTLAAKRDPTLTITEGSLEEMLETMIDRKLLIQEAVKRGLSEDERFIQRIKTFWEQTLIREVIDAKTREWADVLFVTDDEVREHYERMHYRIIADTYPAGNRKEAEEIREVIRSGKTPPGGSKVGPVYLEDIEPASPVHEAFLLNEGETSIIEIDHKYTLVHLLSKEPVEAPEFESIRDRIKVYLLERKKQKALEDWLEDLKHAAEIKIDEKLITKVANE